MKDIYSSRRSGTFKIFYYFALIGWTLSSLGIASALRRNFSLVDLLPMIVALTITALGWSLPSLETKYPESFLVKCGIFIFPIFWSLILLVFLVFLFLFTAA